MSETIRDLRNVPFAQVESELLRDPNIADALIRLYAVLLTYGPHGIFPGQEKLASDTGANRETVNRRLHSLRELGLITWEQRPGSSNEYSILGYANYVHKQLAQSPAAKQEAVTPASQGDVIPTSHLNKSGVIPASQGVCPQDHTRCDPSVTRSILKDLDPVNNMEMVSFETFPGIWKRVRAELALQMTRETFDTWIKPLPAAQLTMLSDDPEGPAEVVIACPNAYFEDWLSHRLHVPIRRTLTDLMGRPVEVHYQVSQVATEPRKVVAQATEPWPQVMQERMSW